MTRKERKVICIAEKVFHTHKFTTMQPTTQALLLQMWFSADDEGVIEDAETIIRTTVSRRASRKPALQELIDNGYIIVSDKPEFAGYAYVVGYREANSGKRWKKASIHGDFLAAIGKTASVQTTKRPAQADNKPLQGAFAATRGNQTGPTAKELAENEERRRRNREAVQRAKADADAQRERELAGFKARGIISDAPSDETEQLRAKLRQRANNLFQTM